MQVISVCCNYICSVTCEYAIYPVLKQTHLSLALFKRLAEGSFSLATDPGRCWSTARLTASLAVPMSR
jgi:hypothetical protein